MGVLQLQRQRFEPDRPARLQRHQEEEPEVVAQATIGHVVVDEVAEVVEDVVSDAVEDVRRVARDERRACLDEPRGSTSKPPVGSYLGPAGTSTVFAIA